jgi:hypothetical protein
MFDSVNRRSFLEMGFAGGTFSLMGYLNGQEKTIPGFDQTKTDYDKTKAWRPFTDRKIRFGLVGYGVCRFATEFDLQNHPNVEVVAVSDLFPDRCAALSKAARCRKTYPSLEEMVKNDSIEAIFCATDAPSHAKHAVLCLEHGKHVATAVPAFYGDIEDAERLLECCKKNSGLNYAMFETSAYHDDVYAMEKIYGQNVFGKLIYSEGEYHHPHVIGEPPLDSYKGWRAHGAPLWYPTHGNAYYVCITHGSLLDVSARGIEPLTGEVKPNGSGNTFRTEIGLCRTNEGGIFRMVQGGSQGEYLEAGRVRGEYAGFCSHNGRLDCSAAFVGDATGRARLEEAIKNGMQTRKYALPPGVSPGGHGGSHGYLGDDFVDSILRGRKPRVGVIEALNLTVPGFYAHRSALKDGESLKIPQYSL